MKPTDDSLSLAEKFSSGISILKPNQDANSDREHTAVTGESEVKEGGEDTTCAEFDDPNLDVSAMGDYEEDSPYPEVRAAVANTDDPSMPVSTI
ncbi:hypothetical protein FRB99_001649, partial [Tulasnella sp. 403]